MTLRVRIIPDKFKGSLSAAQVVSAIEAGVKAACSRRGIALDLKGYPVTDGGDGFVDVVHSLLGGERKSVRVCGPLGAEVDSSWLWLEDRRWAVIEMAAAAGLVQVPEERRNPLHTTSHGVGELILDALRYSPREIVIGIGGSATNDAGCGMCQALGVRFFAGASEIVGPISGGRLAAVTSIDLERLDARLKSCRLTVAADVTNPLCGPTGATYVFGPQKGLRPQDASALDDALAHIAGLFRSQNSGVDPDSPGCGAAGGLGFALKYVLQAELVRGFQMMRDLLALDQVVKQADIVLTGEGQLDRSSADGKICFEVAALAQPVPTYAIVGRSTLTMEQARESGLAGVYSIVDDLGMSTDEAIAAAYQALTRLAEYAMEDLCLRRICV